MSLRPEDFETDTWSRLAQHIHTELQQLRVKNDAHLDAERTATLRGEIKRLKELLALPEKVNRPARVASGGPKEHHEFNGIDGY